jgi:hypothetical protein
MKPTLNEKFLAYLALFSGISLSIVAEYYSILGLMAIFSAAPISVVVMGIALGVGKITATLWLKQNWKIAPWSIRGYLLSAISVLMLITSMGIFGFLSKAHSDASLVSGDVQAKIAVYDEKIRTAKENIDANRKALKQMDEAVDQVMARSSSETGADKAVGLRRSQLKERARLQSEIQAEQKTISRISEERAPIAAEVRKVEAEVGPIKYIAQFVYGETSEGLLEKAVTWVIIILIAVFDPLAVILLLSSQISFQNFRERKALLVPFELGPNEYISDPEEEAFYQTQKPDAWVADVGEKPTAEELAEGDSPEKESSDIVESTATVTESQDPHPPGWMFTDPIAKNKEKELSLLEQHPYLNKPFAHFKNLQPMVYKAEGDSLRRTTDVVDTEPPTVTTAPEMERPGDYLDEPLFVQNEEQRDSSLWTKTAVAITPAEYAEVSEEYKKEQLILHWADLVRTKQITMSDVPKHLLLEIRARV